MATKLQLTSNEGSKPSCDSDDQGDDKAWMADAVFETREANKEPVSFSLYSGVEPESERHLHGANIATSHGEVVKRRFRGRERKAESEEGRADWDERDPWRELDGFG
jgi:hypothetical protein